MKNLIAIIIFSLLFFLTVFPVKAEITAGSSGLLISQATVDLKEIEELRVKKIKIVIGSILNRYNSPLVVESESFVKTCIKYQINCYLLPSISGLESTFGKFIYPNSHNPFGWGGGYIMFNSWSDGFDAVAKGLKNNYIEKGAVTIEEIGQIYAESPTWAERVNFFIDQFKKEEEKIMLLSDPSLVQL